MTLCLPLRPPLVLAKLVMEKYSCCHSKTQCGYGQLKQAQMRSDLIKYIQGALQ